MGVSSTTRVGHSADRNISVGRGLDSLRGPIPSELRRESALVAREKVQLLVISGSDFAKRFQLAKSRDLLARPSIELSKERNAYIAAALLTNKAVPEEAQIAATSTVMSMINDGTIFAPAKQPAAMTILTADPRQNVHLAHVQMAFADDKRTAEPGKMVLAVSPYDVVRYAAIETELRENQSPAMQIKTLTSDRMQHHRFLVAANTRSEEVMRFVADPGRQNSDRELLLKYALMQNPNLTERVKAMLEPQKNLIIAAVRRTFSNLARRK